MSRKYIVCHDVPHISNCTLKISGRGDEVERTAVMHAVRTHGAPDNEELRTRIRENMHDEWGSGGGLRHEGTP